MNRRVLVVYSNTDMLTEITDLLETLRDNEEYELTWNTARNLAQAMDKVREASRFDLVITAVEIWENEKAADGAGEQHRRGLKLVQEVRAKNPEAEAIIVTGQVDNEIFALAQSEKAGLVFHGAGFLDRLRSEMVRFLGPTRPAGSRRVNLEICLSTEGTSTYQFQMEGQPPLPIHPLDVEKGDLKKLVDKSRRIPRDTQTWKSELTEVGEELARELFQPTPKNIQFRDEFNRWEGKLGIRNIRVRFTVQDTLHPIVVEALKQRDNSDYWMLQTAVYRSREPQRNCSVEPHGLFQDEETSEGPLNFLIVQASLPYPDIVSEGEIDGTLEPLPEVAAEAASVEELLQDLKAQGKPIGEVRVIAARDLPDGASLKERVEDLLRNGGTHWHILHYAGHTRYDAEHNTGYLFFPGANGKYEPVKIDLFALWLKNADTRFVFLSSCEGAQQDFIYHLAKERVPAIMGFLWEVSDSKAREFAESFYDKLLGGQERSLEYACLAAKQELHATYENDPIWASPVLVMQVGV
jgi:CheY-like chemotaxis protein